MTSPDNGRVVTGVPAGVYRHWKGDRYLVLFTAQDSNNSADHEDVVVYVSLTRGGIRVRHAAEFTELVPSPDGGQVPRFVLVDFP